MAMASNLQSPQQGTHSHCDRACNRWTRSACPDQACQEPQMCRWDTAGSRTLPMCWMRAQAVGGRNSRGRQEHTCQSMIVNQNLQIRARSGTVLSGGLRFRLHALFPTNADAECKCKITEINRRINPAHIDKNNCFRSRRGVC
jgi:hypothetical protein